MVRVSNRYKLAFQVAAVVAPALMATIGYFYGDIQPVVTDICSVLLPSGSVRPSVTEKVDAGAAR